MLNPNPRSASAILWLWIPVLFFIGWLIFELVAPGDIVNRAVSENGELEILQNIITAIASVYAIRILLTIDGKRYPWMYVWFLLAAFACIYICGEEISWGQWIFYWQTPEQWAAINDQGETNLHNTSSWLDQKPRTVLEMGIVIGGLIMPWLLKHKPEKINTFWRSVSPSPLFGVVAVVYLIIKFFDRIGDAFDIRVFYRAAELVECYLYYFMMLYVIAFDRKAYARIPSSPSA